MTQPETSYGVRRVSENAARILGALTLYFPTTQMELQPQRPDYRRVPIYEGLDMAPIYKIVAAMHPGRREYYQMDFEGKLKQGYNVDVATEIDLAVLQTARQSEAFGAYITGEPDVDGKSKSSCIWTDRWLARTALANPAHDNALALEDMYDGRPVLKHYGVTLLESGAILYQQMTPDWPITGEMTSFKISIPSLEAA